MRHRSAKHFIRYHTRALRDHVANHNRGRGDRRMLFVRHPIHGTKYYWTLLRWLAEQFPEIHAACEVRSVPFGVRDWPSYGVIMSWLGDSNLAPDTWELATIRDLNEAAETHHIPIVNTLTSTLRSSKQQGAATMARAGLRVPRTVMIRDTKDFQRDAGGFEFPLLIRENYGHAGSIPILVVKSLADLQKSDLGRFQHPIAVQFIDVRDDDGLCRRYRYIAAGEIGISFNLHVSKRWEVRGQCRVTNDQTMREERQFIATANPHHETLQRARRALGLEFVGFDYSYDRCGELVVWEANSLPGVTYARQPERQFLAANSDAVFAALTYLLLQRAGLPVPGKVSEIIASAPSVNTPLSWVA